MADIFVAKKKKPEFEPAAFEVPTKESEDKREKFQSEKTFNLRSKEVGLFSSFLLNPSNASFKDQEEDEEIILFLRRHFITNFSWFLITFILIVLPIILFSFRGYLPIPSLPDKFSAILFLFYLTVVVSYVYINFISWYFNISLITQKRLIDINFIDIIYHDMSVTKLNLIEDVSFTQSGFLRSFLDYGDLSIQTAGEKRHFDFSSVPEPDHVLNIIERLMGGDKHVA